MSDPILDIESSEESSKPRELYTITHGTTTYRFTSADHDIIHDGFIYKAEPAARGDLPVSNTSEDAALELMLPIDHALVRRYLQLAVPPQKIEVALQRKYFSSGDVETAWMGEITSVGVDNENTEATFRVEAKGSKAAKRMLPTITTGRLCPHILYGADCKVSRNGSSPDALAHKVTATVLFVDGRDVRVDLGDTDRNGTWAELGELVHVSSGERMTIREQNDQNPGVSAVADLSLQLPIPGLAIGDSVEIYRGCDWKITTCRDAFGNQVNYGGTPDMPQKNPFRLNAFGVFQDG